MQRATLADIRPGEGAMVVKTAAVLFFVIAAHTVLETARDTLFLGELPASRLAIVYAVLALVAAAASRLSTRVVLRFGRRSGLLVTLLVAAYGCGIFYLLPKTHAALYGLYVFSGLVSSVAVVQFWMLSSHWFSGAQGRRLFGLISAGGVIGALVGASFAIATIRWAGVESLLLVSIGFYFAAALLVTSVSTEDENLRLLGAEVRTHGTLQQAARFLRANPYVTRLAALLALSTCALLVTDYLFKSVAARSFGATDLGGFFASYYAAQNGLALLVQLLVSGYLVRRLGVLSAFLVLPALLFAGALSAVALGGATLAVLATKAADGGLRHSLHRVTSELLWMPLPEDVRAASRTFVDTVVVRAAQASSASVLLLCASRDWDGPVQLSIGLAVLCGAWIALGIRLRRPYLDLFRSSLVSRQKVVATQLDLDAVEVVVEALASRDPVKVMAAMQLLSSNGRAGLIPALILYHESADVLRAALDAIGTRDRTDWIPLAERLLDHGDGEVRIAAMRAMARAGVFSGAEEGLYDVRPEVRGHAAYLVERRDASTEPREHPAIRDVLSLDAEAGAMARLGLLASIAATPEPRYAVLLSCLAEDTDERVVTEAVSVMARFRDARFVPLLVQRLATRSARTAARAALAAQGPRALRRLARALSDVTTPERIRRHIPRAIASFASQRALDLLVAELSRQRRGNIRYRLIRAIGRLVTTGAGRVKGRRLEPLLEQTLIEHLRMAALASRLRAAEVDPGVLASPECAHLLVALLQDKAGQALDRAFRLLQIMHPSEDVRSIESAANSSDARARGSALEYMDALTVDAAPRVRRLFTLIIDELSLGESLDRAQADIGWLPSDLESMLVLLREDGDPAIAALGLRTGVEVSHAV